VVYLFPPATHYEVFFKGICKWEIADFLFFIYSRSPPLKVGFYDWRKPLKELNILNKNDIIDVVF
jgi:hypothetical protein